MKYGPKGREILEKMQVLCLPQVAFFSKVFAPVAPGRLANAEVAGERAAGSESTAVEAGRLG